MPSNPHTPDKDVEPYIIIEGGKILNNPSLPIFDLDGLTNHNLDWIHHFYEQMIGVIIGWYAHTGGGFKLEDLPIPLRDVLVRTEDTIVGITGVDAELVAAARHDQRLFDDICTT
jgi:hypothetical protein